MNKKTRVLFFGSTSDSIIVLERLHQSPITNPQLTISAVVTQPPHPVGRKQILTPTPVDQWAKEHTMTTLSFPSDDEKPWLYADQSTVIDALAPLKADLLVSACYGQKIPTKTITDARYGGLNVHPSLLPHWRGADPVPWAIATGDHQTGVTIVTLTEIFDKGRILAQKKIPITDHDFADPLRTKLFALGADLLAGVLPCFLASKGEALKGSPVQGDNLKGSYARRLTRKDGFEKWETIEKAITDGTEAVGIDRKFRGFSPWPGLWTEIEVSRVKNHVSRKTKKHLKILSCHLSPVTCHLILDTVQLEGKKPVPFTQFSSAYLPPKANASTPPS